MPKGYLVAHVTVTDQAEYDAYRREVPGVIAQYGGRFVVRGGTADLVENADDFGRVVVVEFPSLEDARRFYHSPEYAPLIAQRTRATRSEVALVEGVDG